MTAAALANHLWQSTVFAAAVAVLAVAWRRHRAAVRYAIWFSASIKFLVPFALLIALGSRIGPVVVADHDGTPQPIATLVQIGEPFRSAAVTAPVSDSTPRNTRDWARDAAGAAWLIGVIAITTARRRTWRRIRAVARSSTPLPLPGRLVSVPLRAASGIEEPGVIGIFNPLILLPSDIRDRLSDAQLEAVLAHEQCHIRRRDNLTAAVHMAVETIFWFHPLVWWIGARLVDERERACDEEVLGSGHDASVYARAILLVCSHAIRAPLACVSGVSGPPLKPRIEAIVANRTGSPLDRVRRMALVTAAAAAMAFPLGIGALAPRTASAQATRQESSDATLARFDAASVKVNRSGQIGGGFHLDQNGRVVIENTTVADLVSFAYDFPNPYPRERILGLPAWTLTERYDVIAKGAALSSGAESPLRRVSLMMRALLIDRFGLRARFETRDAAIYELRLNRSDVELGPRLIRTARPDCDAMLAGRSAFAGTPEVNWNPCGVAIGTGTIRAGGVRTTQLATALSRLVGRPVVDRTDLRGTFDAVLTFSIGRMPRDLPIPTRVDPNEPELFTALQEQLGLKLQPARGPAEFLVVEHVNRPTEN